MPNLSTGRRRGRCPIPDVAPHLTFVDIGGHGYATVRLTGDEMRTEFVCIPRPVTRSAARTAGRFAIAWSTPRSCGAPASGRAQAASPRGRSRPVHLEAESLNADWYWQALSRRDRACLRPADRDRARLRLRELRAGHARRRRSHLHLLGPGSRARRTGRATRSAVRRRGHRRGRRAVLAIGYAHRQPQDASPTRPRRSPRW